MAAASSDADECEAQRPAARGAMASSMLQIGSSRVSVSEERLENERVRENMITDHIVERRKLQVSGMVLEDMDPADAVSLMRSFAGSIDRHFFENVNLVSDAHPHELFLDQMNSLHTFLCRISEGTSDCEAEYTQVLTDAFNSFMGAATSFVQYVTGTRRETRSKVTKQGVTDPELLSLLQDNLIKSMRYSVSVGEDPDAMKRMVRRAMRKISDLSDDSLLEYTGRTKAELTAEYVRLALETICVHTTASCSERIEAEIAEVSGFATDAGVPIGATLLQASLRPVVQLLMKVFDLPERPQETQAERSAAIKVLMDEE